MTTQLELLSKLYQEDEYLLIVLENCPSHIFDKNWQRYLRKGRHIPVKGNGATGLAGDTLVFQDGTPSSVWEAQQFNDHSGKVALHFDEPVKPYFGWFSETPADCTPEEAYESNWQLTLGVVARCVARSHTYRIVVTNSSRKDSFWLEMNRKCVAELQSPLLDDLFDEEEFTLIILDACRFDSFEKAYQKHLSGELRKVWSVGSATPEWIHGTLDRNLEDVLMVSGHPAINSRGAGNWNFAAGDRFGRVLDAFRDEKLDITHPGRVWDMYRQHSDWDKSLLWFMQPHGPYITAPPHKMKETREAIKNHQADLLRHAYESDLNLALEYVAKVCKRARGRVVVTSDHGELLGDDSLFWHKFDSDHRILREVPWLEVTR